MDSVGEYGRGMPLAISRGNSFSKRKALLLWVAACRDRTTTATHQWRMLVKREEGTEAWIAQRRYGRGMPRPISRGNYFNKRKALLLWVVACRDRTTTATHQWIMLVKREEGAEAWIAQRRYSRGMPRPISGGNSFSKRKALLL